MDPFLYHESISMILTICVFRLLSAEAEKILIVKAAEAEAEARYLSGLGVARQRKVMTLTTANLSLIFIKRTKQLSHLYCQCYQHHQLLPHLS